MDLPARPVGPAAVAFQVARRNGSLRAGYCCVPMVPVELRAAVRGQLERLVAGEMPEQLVWVENYGRTGAVLVPQPDLIWEHPWSDAVPTDDGGWHVVVPLFTETESPSDLSAEIIIDPTGTAAVYDVHVL